MNAKKAIIKNNLHKKMAKYKLEYLWLDGYTPVPNVRGKTRIGDYVKNKHLIFIQLLAFYKKLYWFNDFNQRTTGTCISNVFNEISFLW